MRLTRLLLLLFSLAVAQGCKSWQLSSLPRGAQPAEHPMRVTLKDGSVLVLEHPRIVGDSLIGDGGDQRQRLVLLLRDVAQVEQSSVNAGESIALVLVVGMVVVATLALLFLAAYSSGRH